MSSWRVNWPGCTVAEEKRPEKRDVLLPVSDESIRAARLHLAYKYDDAKSWAKATEESVMAKALPVARTGLVAAHSVAEWVRGAWKTAQERPGLLGASVVALTAMRLFSGWKLKTVLVVSLAAGWVALAPQEVSTLSKAVLRTANSVSARVTGKQEAVANTATEKN